MKNNLLKNLIAATVIIFTVGISVAWAETLEEKLNLLPLKERNWINDSCPKLLGPKLWTNCVEKECDVVTEYACTYAFVGLPSIRGAASHNPQSMESW